MVNCSVSDILSCEAVQVHSHWATAAQRAALGGWHDQAARLARKRAVGLRMLQVRH